MFKNIMFRQIENRHEKATQNALLFIFAVPMERSNR